MLDRAKYVIGLIVKRDKGACAVFTMPVDRIKLVPVSDKRLNDMIEEWWEFFMGVYEPTVKPEWVAQDLEFMRDRRLGRKAA